MNTPNSSSFTVFVNYKLLRYFRFKIIVDSRLTSNYSKMLYIMIQAAYNLKKMADNDMRYLVQWEDSYLSVIEKRNIIEPL